MPLLPFKIKSRSLLKPQFKETWCKSFCNTHMLTRQMNYTRRVLISTKLRTWIPNNRMSLLTFIRGIQRRKIFRWPAQIPSSKRVAKTFSQARVNHWLIRLAIDSNSQWSKMFQISSRIKTYRMKKSQC